MKRKTLLLVVLASLALSAAPAGAQEILLEGPLAGAPAVRRLVLFREGRFFATPSISFTILDTYRRHMLFGLKGEYNIFDWLSAGFYAGGGFGWRTGVADQIHDKGVDQVPGQNYDLNFPARILADGSQGLDQQLGQLQFLGVVEGRVIPLRGKLSVFGKLFLAIDVYINLGVGIALVNERGATNCNADELAAMGLPRPNDQTCPTDAYLPMQQRVAVGPSFGGGVTVFFNDWIGLNLEYRSTPFAWNQSGTDEFGTSEVELDRKIDENDHYLYWNHMMTIGCTFAFPLSAERTE